VAPAKKAEKSEKANDGNGGVCTMLKKYIQMFPFVRKELGELAANPNKAMPKEIENSTAIRGLKDAAISAFVFSTVMSLFWIIFSMRTLLPALAAMPLVVVGMVISVYAISLVATILLNIVLELIPTACVYYLIAKVLGGKGSFGKTLGMLSTISAPRNLLLIALLVISGILMAIVNTFLGSLYTIAYILVILGGTALAFFQLYLNYKMVRMLHGLSRGKSVVVVAIPPLMAIAVVMALVSWIISIVASIMPAA
jgi:hypothetical protein